MNIKIYIYINQHYNNIIISYMAEEKKIPEETPNETNLDPDKLREILGDQYKIVEKSGSPKKESKANKTLNTVINISGVNIKRGTVLKISGIEDYYKISKVDIKKNIIKATIKKSDGSTDEQIFSIEKDGSGNENIKELFDEKFFDLKDHQRSFSKKRSSGGSISEVKKTISNFEEKYAERESRQHEKKKVAQALKGLPFKDTYFYDDEGEYKILFNNINTQKTKIEFTAKDGKKEIKEMDFDELRSIYNNFIEKTFKEGLPLKNGRVFLGEKSFYVINIDYYSQEIILSDNKNKKKYTFDEFYDKFEDAEFKNPENNVDKKRDARLQKTDSFIYKTDDGSGNIKKTKMYLAKIQSGERGLLVFPEGESRPVYLSHSQIISSIGHEAHKKLLDDLREKMETGWRGYKYLENFKFKKISNFDIKSLEEELDRASAFLVKIPEGMSKKISSITDYIKDIQTRIDLKKNETKAKNKTSKGYEYIKPEGKSVTDLLVEIEKAIKYTNRFSKNSSIDRHKAYINSLYTEIKTIISNKINLPENKATKKELQKRLKNSLLFREKIKDLDEKEIIDLFNKYINRLKNEINSIKQQKPSPNEIFIESEAEKEVRLAKQLEIFNDKNISDDEKMHQIMLLGIDKVVIHGRDSFTKGKRGAKAGERIYQTTTESIEIGDNIKEYDKRTTNKEEGVMPVVKSGPDMDARLSMMLFEYSNYYQDGGVQPVYEYTQKGGQTTDTTPGVYMHLDTGGKNGSYIENVDGKIHIYFDNHSEEKTSVKSSAHSISDFIKEHSALNEKKIKESGLSEDNINKALDYIRIIDNVEMSMDYDFIQNVYPKTILALRDEIKLLEVIKWMKKKGVKSEIKGKDLNTVVQLQNGTKKTLGELVKGSEAKMAKTIYNLNQAFDAQIKSSIKISTKELGYFTYHTGPTFLKDAYIGARSEGFNSFVRFDKKNSRLMINSSKNLKKIKEKIEKSSLSKRINLVRSHMLFVDFDDSITEEKLIELLDIERTENRYSKMSKEELKKVKEENKKKLLEVSQKINELKASIRNSK